MKKLFLSLIIISMVVIPSFVSAQNTKFDEVFDSLMVIIKKIDRAKIVVQASLNEDSLATVQVAKANVELATTRTNEAMEKLFLAEEHKKETSAKISAEMENLIIFLKKETEITKELEKAIRK